MIELELAASPHQDAADFARDAASSPGLLELRPQRQPKKSAGSRFFVCRMGDGCACSLLSDSADWDQPFYALSPDHTEAFVATLEFVAARSTPQVFAIRAAWIDGDFQNYDAARVQNVALADLLADIESGRIGNNVRYVVDPNT